MVRSNNRFSYFLADKLEQGKYYMGTSIHLGEERLNGWHYENGFLFNHMDSLIAYNKVVNFEGVENALHNVAGPYGIGVSTDNFTAIAIGNIDGDAEFDIWIINEDKNLINIFDDVTGSSGKIIQDFFFLEIYNSGFVLFLDRLAILLFVLNLGLWLLFLRKLNGGWLAIFGGRS